MKKWSGGPTGLNRSDTRAVRGATSFNNSNHLPPRAESSTMKPVMLPLGCARLATKPLPIGSVTSTNTIGVARVSRARAAITGVTEDRVGPKIDQLFCQRLDPIGKKIEAGKSDSPQEVNALAARPEIRFMLRQEGMIK